MTGSIPLVSCLSEYPVAAMQTGIDTGFDCKSIPCETLRSYMYTAWCAGKRVAGLDWMVQDGQSTACDVFESLAGITHTAKSGA